MRNQTGFGRNCLRIQFYLSSWMELEPVSSAHANPLGRVIFLLLWASNVWQLRLPFLCLWNPHMAETLGEQKIWSSNWGKLQLLIVTSKYTSIIDSHWFLFPGIMFLFHAVSIQEVGKKGSGAEGHPWLHSLSPLCLFLIKNRPLNHLENPPHENYAF